MYNKDKIMCIMNWEDSHIDFPAVEASDVTTLVDASICKCRDYILGSINIVYGDYPFCITPITPIRYRCFVEKHPYNINAVNFVSMPIGIDGVYETEELAKSVVESYWKPKLGDLHII